MNDLTLLNGVEIREGVYIWSGELLSKVYPFEKHPDTDLVLVTNDGKSFGFDCISELAEELEIELDQSWDSEASSLQAGEYRLVQSGCDFRVAKVDLSNPRELWGVIEDYYPDEEIDEERLYAWKRSRIMWTQAVQALDFIRASKIEREWGDDPATRRIIKEMK